MVWSVNVGGSHSFISSGSENISAIYLCTVCVDNCQSHSQFKSFQQVLLFSCNVWLGSWKIADINLNASTPTGPTLLQGI